ncbi:MAG TPA: hypothetical protein VJC07_00770 [Candidatus Nanoarchaeia archaeon]|nr:hypothetical protein [Candidatus Nanoarchaeia archaeon]
MVYKKHIKKRGAKIGPYHYTSLRLAKERVKSIYLGKFRTLKDAEAKEKAILAHHKAVVQNHSPKPRLAVKGGRSPLFPNNPGSAIEKEET